jgi:hypothetical protein
MARHESKVDKKLMDEHAHGMERHRARGGEIDKAEDQDEEAHEEEHDAEGDDEKKRAAGGGVQARKRGGAIKGEKPKHRPDKRARGGATSDMNPLSSAGKMTTMPFERVTAKEQEPGRGMDRD